MNHNARTTRVSREMRYRLWDCVVRVRSTTEDKDGVPRNIVAHRAILAGWPYFAALFRHTEPAAWEPPAEGGSKGTARPVYDIAVPFASTALHALIEGVYDSGKECWSAEDSGCDPVDAVRCAIYLGEDERMIRDRIECVLDALCDPVDADKTRYRDMSTFVRHIVDVDLNDALKCSLIARFHYLFDDAERADIAERHGALVPKALYAGQEPAPHNMHIYSDSITALLSTRRVVRGAMCDLDGTVMSNTKVVRAVEGAEIHVWLYKSVVGVWHVDVRLFHPFRPHPCSARFTMRASSNQTFTILGETENDDLPPFAASPLTACEIVLSPVAPAF